MTTPLFDLTGKVALVTGSTRGLGLAIAQAFVQHGARVVVSSENAADTAATAERLGSVGITCDVADDAAVAALVAQTRERLGGLDILVSNAGISGAGAADPLDMSGFDRVMAVNLRSMVVLTKHALPLMAERPGASVTLISSLSGLRGNGRIEGYAMAKAGVVQLARNLAVQWGPKGVRTNAIAPGLIRTGFADSLLGDEAFMKRRMQMTPLRRPGEGRRDRRCGRFPGLARRRFRQRPRAGRRRRHGDHRRQLNLGRITLRITSRITSRIAPESLLNDSRSISASIPQHFHLTPSATS